MEWNGQKIFFRIRVKFNVRIRFRVRVTVKDRVMVGMVVRVRVLQWREMGRNLSGFIYLFNDAHFFIKRHIRHSYKEIPSGSLSLIGFRATLH